MTDFSEVLSQGAAHAWLYIPSAVLLGALHGMEPGHSKTMMAAFIIAIRGTISQAVLLGLSAALSHSFVIWALAAAALKFGSHWSAETTEPYFQLGSAVIVGGLAVWMFLRTRRDAKAAEHHHHHHHHHEHGHGHSHSHDETKVFDTGHGLVTLSVYENGVPPVFRLRFSKDGKTFVPKASHVMLETVRAGGDTKIFEFEAKEEFLQSRSEIPEPHEFEVRLNLGHGDHSHRFVTHYEEHAHDHAGHHHDLGEDAEFQDAHEAAHAEEIQKRFANREVTTPQIILFGLTGGLLPCPAAFTVLLVCMQVKQFTLGFALVGAFSFGLAITMVAAGVIAAWSVRHAEKRFSGFGELMRKAPYLSCALLLALGTFMAWQGWHGLAAQR